MILPDYHMHTPRCNHAEGSMSEYFDHALSVGLKEIGMSDHMPVMPEPAYCMGFDELSSYADEFHTQEEIYRDRISIKFGCEMDIELDRVDDIRKILEDYQFDYVIGSIHYLKGWPFDQEQYTDTFSKEPMNDIYRRFFDAIIAGMETGLYDIVGHIDNIKCMGFRPDVSLLDDYERVAQAAKENDLTVEINMSGIDKPVGEQYPAEEFLKILRKYDVPLTSGSDSHKPYHVGRYYDLALELIKKAGYTEIMYFTKRKRIPVELSAVGNSPVTDSI